MNQRIEKAKKLLEENHVDLLLIDHPTDLYYLTGLNLSTGKLYISHNQAKLFVDGRYIEYVQENATIPSALFEEEKSFLLSYNTSKIGFDSSKTTYKTYLSFSHNFIPLDAPLKKLRAIKDAKEIEKLTSAANLGSIGYDFTLTALQEGISEKEVAIELEIYWRRKGASGPAFDSIIAFGENSSMPHYRAGNRTLRLSDIVLIDIGVTLDHYHSDMTRTHFYGTPNPKLEEIYKIVKEAQAKALLLCKPGSSIYDLDMAARNHIQDYGFGPNFTHSLGHGIGLDVHEWPLIKATPESKETYLEKNMVITIEPGIYLPGLGGVRLENTIIITDTGYLDLTNRPL